MPPLLDTFAVEVADANFEKVADVEDWNSMFSNLLAYQQYTGRPADGRAFVLPELFLDKAIILSDLAVDELLSDHLAVWKKNVRILRRQNERVD